MQLLYTPYIIVSFYALIYTRKILWMAIWLCALAAVGFRGFSVFAYLLSFALALVTAVLTWVVASAYNPQYEWHPFVRQWAWHTFSAETFLQLCVSLIFQVFVFLVFVPYDDQRPSRMLLCAALLLVLTMVVFLYDKHIKDPLRIVPFVVDGAVAGHWHRWVCTVATGAIVVDTMLKQPQRENLWLMGVLLFYVGTRFWSWSRVFFALVRRDHAFTNTWFSRMLVADPHARDDDQTHMPSHPRNDFRSFFSSSRFAVLWDSGHKTGTKSKQA